VAATLGIFTESGAPLHGENKIQQTIKVTQQLANQNTCLYPKTENALN
jgi:hypothetical protein